MLTSVGSLPVKSRQEVYSAVRAFIHTTGTTTTKEVQQFLQEKFPNTTWSADAIARWSKRQNPELHIIYDTGSYDSSNDSDVSQIVSRETERLQQKELVNTLRDLQRTEVKRQQYITAIRDALTPFEPLTPIPSTVRRLQHAGHYWVLVLSDWHLGQYTPLMTTGGIYQQSTLIVKQQVDMLLNDIRAIHKVESKGKSISEILVLFLGDIVEGDCLRPSQARAIDMVVTKQVVEGFDLAVYFLRSLLHLPGIKKISAHLVGGNHDRTSSKPGAAGGGELDFCDSFSWLIGALMQRALQDEKRIEVTNWETFFGFVQFAGQRLVWEHGGSFRTSSSSYGGIPWYPIVNAAGRYGDMLGQADLVFMGHFHKPAILPYGQSGHIIMNGALPATSQYIQSSFKSIRMPMQWLLSFHEQHGLIAAHPLYCPPEQMPVVGEQWKQ